MEYPPCSFLQEHGFLALGESKLRRCNSGFEAAFEDLTLFEKQGTLGLAEVGETLHGDSSLSVSGFRSGTFYLSIRLSVVLCFSYI